MKAILLCGYRQLADDEPVLGEGLLDSKIRDLRAMGSSEIVVVLGGPRADEYLIKSKLIHDIELVFDTNDDLSLMTNLRAGLKAGEHITGCFVIPIEIESPDTAVWKFLLNEGRQAQYSEQTHIVQAIDELGAPFQSGFPLFVTRQGNKFIQETKELTGLLDARLSYLHQVYQQEADVAQEGLGL